jgi:hypothetical protein
METRETRRAGGGAGLGRLSFPERNNNRDLSPNHAPSQVKSATIIDATNHFRRATARRREVLTVLIGVRAGASPHGRSRPFALSAGALDRLLDAAALLEWGP